MNFTEKVKLELSGDVPNPRHCRLAELGGLMSVLAKYDGEDGKLVIALENELVLKITEKLINKIFPVDNDGRIIYDIKRSGKEKRLILFSEKEKEEVLKAVKLDKKSLFADPVLYTMTCCKRAFLKGVFLGAGSLTDPNKDYHYEISLSDEDHALCIRDILCGFDADAKIVRRKKQFVVYVKDSSMISEILNIMGAPVAMMELENVRILKDVRNRVNRQVNCDAANINKALAASQKQLSDIAFIREKNEFEGLTEELKEIAVLRERYPEATLAELVVYNGETVGKSGINHRLRKLADIAEKLRES